jgi:hypothetical protein
VKPSDTKPTKLIYLTYAGGLCLAVGTLLLGIGLVTAG